MASVGFLETTVARRLLRQVLLASLAPAMLIALVSISVTTRALERSLTEATARSTEAASLLVLGRLAARSATLEGSDTLGANASGASAVRLLVSPRPAGDADLQLVGGQAELPHMRVLGAAFWKPIDDLLPDDGAALCLFDVETRRRVHCSPGVTTDQEHRLSRVGLAASSVVVHTDSLVIGTRELFLRRGWGAANWRLVLETVRGSERSDYRRILVTLVLLLGVALATAFTVAHRALRRGTAPLGVLRDVTRQLRNGDLTARVPVRSGDEFAELGDAFNHLSSTLGRQFELLAALDHIDATVLRYPADDPLLEAATTALARAAVWEAADVGAMQDDGRLRVRCWRRSDGASWEVVEDRPAADAALPEGVRLLFHGGEAVGALRLVPSDGWTDEARRTADLFADRLAVALGNIRLFARIGALSAGTLRAFANAIDANSPWTAGHSERVTHLALELARALGADEIDLRRLYRGGLMHDVGKVAVPPTILDKAGALSPDERAIIERHPATGVAILTPIGTFADILPIVRSHHEWFDGTGYPERLAGEAIPWLARVLAVADVYDALTSSRPYRAGLSRDRTMSLIREGSGTQFDPRVVQALDALDYDVTRHDLGKELRSEDSAIRPPAHRSPAAPVASTGGPARRGAG